MLHMYKSLNSEYPLATNALTTVVGAAVGAYLGIGDTNTELRKTILECIGGAQLLKFAVDACVKVQDYVNPPARHAAHRR